MNALVTHSKKAVALAAIVSLAACKPNPWNPNPKIDLEDHSATPVLLKKLPGFEKLETYSLISSDDVLPQSPKFVFGGSADGAGLIKNPAGGYTYILNHEDNFAVSRISFNNNFKPVKGEYILNSTGGLWRLCSATMATQQEHGFGPLYLTCGESGEESRIHAVSPLETSFNPSMSKELPALGRWSSENAVPLSKHAFPGKTVIIIGDDDSGNEGGQLVMYVSNSVGDLTGGSVYVLRRKDKNIREKDMTTGNSYDVEFVKINDAATKTGRQLQEASVALQSVKFGRVEDIDYRKGKYSYCSREIYFNVTGQNNSGANADFSRTKYGRTYKLVLDEKSPLKGKLEVILDGDNKKSIAAPFQNPDNICVTENYVYIQEDPNGYGDETHDSYLYQYNINTKELKTVFELDHRRTAPDAAKYNVGGSSRYGSWEYGSLIDVSDVINVPNTFMLCIQPHTWRDAKYKGVDGGSLRPDEDQASQVVLVKGLPK
ncbi:hypothetical protein [Foetidibacter luteolus]|uniref:hypothetical protein n=1 Tax=Foetidibacter luteolus TaxID=2608880 RepID=UPI00129BE235|nr:hypothetical protein [Foetidibacter luteolus]